MNKIDRIKSSIRYKEEKYNAILKRINTYDLGIDRQKGIADYEDLDKLKYAIKKLERMLKQEIDKQLIKL